MARLFQMIVLLVACFELASSRTADEKEVMLKAIRMKTSRQLKEIFDELGVSHKGLDKDGLRKLAYKENAVGRWEELHPEKKAKPRSSSGGGGGGGGYKGGDFGGKAPDGMDPLEWEKLMGQMKGNFAHEPDPERRRILEKLSKKGMSFGGGSDMDTEQLRNMEKMLDGMGGGGFGGGPGGGGGGFGGVPPEMDASRPARAADDDEELADEDKMEL